MAFATIEPFGGLRGDYQAALVASAVFRAAGDEAAIDDLLLQFRDQPEDEADDWESCEAAKCFFAKVARFSGGTVYGQQVEALYSQESGVTTQESATLAPDP